MPAVGIITSEFTDAAEVQNRYIGYDPAFVVVAHPIQDRSTDELHGLAEGAFTEIVGALSGPDGAEA